MPDVWYSYIQHDSSSIHESFQRNYYNGMIPYIEASSVLDLEEDERIRNHMRMSYIRILYGSINKDCLERKETNYGSIRNHVAEMMNHKVIEDSIHCLDLKDPQIRPVDKINVLLLRHGIVYPVVLQKKMLKLLRDISLRKKES